MTTDHASAALQLAHAAWKNGEVEKAKAGCEAVLKTAPDHADALHLLGFIEHYAGNSERAVDLIGKAIELRPDSVPFYIHHGLALQELRQAAAAIDSYDKAIALNPLSAVAHYNRGNAFQTLDQMEAAVAAYDKAIAIKPGYAEALSNRGNALKALDQFDAAIASYQKAIAINQTDERIYANLAFVLQRQGRLAEAEAMFRQVIALNPKDGQAHYNLAGLLQIQGRLAEAEAHCREAISLRPDDASAFSRLLFILDLTLSATTASLQLERKRWAERFVPELNVSPFANSRDPDRRLRIGYVSADFRNHSASLVFGAMLVKFDPREFEVFAYHNSPLADDATDLFRSAVTQWRNIDHLSDADTVTMIRGDEIDILVDLSGHSAGNRLGVFAKKPAPIQVTAWGYITGTGMKAIDVIFSDPVVIPEDEKSLYAEEVVYLPNVACASFFMRKFPDVSELPALSGKGLTFGSFNRIAKVSDKAFEVWARVLLAVPESRMIIKIVELDFPHQRERVLKHFSDAGIDPSRVTLLGPSSWLDHLSAYNQLDISLDPFPHSGGVTTLEGLMMGVPVVTLKWPTLVGRLSASFLTAMGMTSWIATTEDEYVRIAVQKAANLNELSDLRRSLRTRLGESIVGDVTAYVAAVEQEYRRLWKRWCEARA